VNANGRNGSLKGNFNRWVGLAADFSGAYKNGQHVNTYMFGPVFSAHSDKMTPFAHCLATGREKFRISERHEKNHFKRECFEPTRAHRLSC
jgi:hypothetical protein